jgi:hypothetical protein
MMFEVDLTATASNQLQRSVPLQVRTNPERWVFPSNSPLIEAADIEVVKGETRAPRLAPAALTTLVSDKSWTTTFMSYDQAAKPNLNHVLMRESSEHALANLVEEPKPFFVARRERRRLKIPRIVPSVTSRLWLLHKWQGQVLKITDDTFEAQLFDLSNPSIVERAEFPKSAVTSEQLALLRPGALFYWFIGYKDIGQTREHVSQIWMRRGGRLGRKKFEEELGKIKKIWGSIAKPEFEITPRG